MGMSRSGRIIILLAIDTVFFFLEIIVGYAVHSLALVADSFHMLNDVFSLLVALWAIKLSRQKSTSSYTYGWQRAEVLGALVNGVFLLALCLSIFLEAIQRFFEPQIISNPVLILVVGSCGLASNLVGLVLFHDHGHAHGPAAPAGARDVEAVHDHAHVTAEPVGVEHVHVHTHTRPTPPILDEGGSIEEILPETVVARTVSAGEITKHKHRRPSTPDISTRSAHIGGVPASPFTLAKMTGEHRHGESYGSHSTYAHSRGDSRHRTFADPNTSIHVYPAQNRQEIINAAAEQESHSSSDDEECAILASSPSKDSRIHVVDEDHDHSPSHDTSENTPLLSSGPGTNYTTTLQPRRNRTVSVSHSTHHHSQPKPATDKGHSHQNLNMRGVFLHVLGDALGNIGVILTAVFIWKTDYSWKYYSDPVISLFITAIIFTSALPLVKSASKILLQAVPKGISLEEVKEDIMSIEGVESVHELHIWQLSDVKMIASLHIQVAFDPVASGGGGERYMRLARAIRTCLHAYGIHSSTIQPEYTPCSINNISGGNNNSPSGSASVGGRSYADVVKNGGNNGNSPKRIGASPRDGDGNIDEDPRPVDDGSLASADTCLLECGDECGGGKCCGPMVVSEGHGHAH